ncbi:hypothetical protein BC941DRAFT_440908 [Chlamydoabsidia padenii]|nr:hypothetical protein BC941DRAFT_440908 [Chlamydoabsidia padenii]
MELFWALPCHPQGRNIWCRLLGKLYSNDTLSKQDDHHTPSCHFSPSLAESLDYLFVTSPRKWEIWSSAFQSIMPTINITQDMLSRTINHLDAPQDWPQDNNIWLLCECGIQAIWRYHWQYKINSFPFTNKSHRKFGQIDTRNLVLGF